MAPGNTTRGDKSQPTGTRRKSRASKDADGTVVASDGADESATQVQRVEDEEIAEEIKNTASKLELLKNPNAGLDEGSRDFLQKLAADQLRITAKLEEAKTAISKDKVAHEQPLLELLRLALAPVTRLPDKTEPCKPLQIDQVLPEGQYLHQQSMLLFDESKALLQIFKALAAPNSEDSPLTEFAHKFCSDRNYIKEIFAAGRKVGKSAITAMLADKNNEVSKEVSLSEDERYKGKVVFNMAEEDAHEKAARIESEGWGNVACRAVRAAHRMEAVGTGQ